MSPYCGSPYSYWNSLQVWNAFLASVWQWARVHIPNHPKYCTSPSSSLEVSHSLSSQSSGKVERANWVLKETLTKLMIELHQDWSKLFPLALLKVLALPTNPLSISPFEAMYGRSIIPLGLPPSPGRSQTAISPSYSFTCPDTRCHLAAYGWLTSSTTHQSFIPIP